MIKIYFLLAIFLLSFSSLFAQVSTMWLMNGKKVLIQEYTLLDDDFDEGVVQYINANGKQKTKDADDVFSITSPTDEEKVIYAKDINLGNEFSITEMRSFLTGKTDIKKNYKGTWFTIGGVASGIAGAFIPPVSIEGNSGSAATIPLGPLVPLAYVVIAGNTTKTFSQLQEENPEINNDDHYLMGCQKGIQEKRMKNSIIGAVIGLAAGIITLSAIQ